MSLIEMIKTYAPTLILIGGVAGAAWGAFKGLVWWSEWVSPLERQRAQGREIAEVKQGLAEHLDECRESNRQLRSHVDTRMDGVESKVGDVADQVSKLAGMMEIIRDRLD